MAAFGTAAQLAAQSVDGTHRIAEDLKAHTMSDEGRFSDINRKLDLLLNARIFQQGFIKALLLLAAGTGTIVALVLEVYHQFFY